jgi:hypothetical protein
MKYHKYDPVTKLYVETVDAILKPKNSVAGNLPDQTEHYTLAYMGDKWVSVLRPEFEIVDDTIQKKPSVEEPSVEKQSSPVEE